MTSRHKTAAELRHQQKELRKKKRERERERDKT